MAENSNLKRMLELSNRIDGRGAGQAPQQAARRAAEAPTIVTESQLADMENKVFGDYQPPEGKYDAQREMEAIKNGFAGRKPTIDLEKTRLPRSIVESIINNPLDITPDMVEDPRMNRLMDKITASNAQGSGIKNVADIQRRLDEGDRQKASDRMIEKATSSSAGGTAPGIDYSLIRNIVEGVVNDKLNDFRNEIKDAIISESVNRKHGAAGDGIKALTFRDGKFLYLTESGDVYECRMEYKGKNRKKTS